MKKHIKQNKRQLQYFIGGASLLVVLIGLVLAGVFLSRALAKPVIGFRDVPNTVKESITSLAEEQSLKTGKKWKVITIDPNLSIKEQKKLFYKTDLLITTSGAGAKILGAHASVPPQSILALMPTAIRTAGSNGTKQYALPVLLDHFELAWNIKLLRKAGLEPPKTINDLISACQKVKGSLESPFICAGKDDETLLSLVGALVESFSGEKGWKEVSSAAISLAPEKLLETPSLNEALNTLISWRKEGLLHPEWFRMNKADVESFMENNYTVFVAMSLTDHRQVPQKVIEKFNSTYFPGLSEGSSRSFTAPAILALTPNKKKVREEALLFRNSLLGSEVQTSLSGRTGLAPTVSQAQAPDKQADDVRFWVASSSIPLPSLYTALYAEPEKIKELAKEIREYLETEGNSK